MNKHTLSLSLSLLAAFGIALSAQASPASVGDQANGMLGSPAIENSSQDPLVRQAVKWIHSNAVRTEHFVPINGAVSHKNVDKTLILGYPEAVPM
jgi:hypothetical protein